MTAAQRNQLISAFAVAALFASALCVIALDEGSYDLVVRQRWATVAWWAVALATVFGLAPRNRPAIGGAAVLGGLSLLLIWTACSFAWGDDDERTLTEVARLGSFIGCMALVTALLPRHRWREAAAGLTAGAVIVCGVALASRLLPDSFDATVVVFTGETGRLSYPFGYWNAIGAWAGMTSGLCLGWSAHARAGICRSAALAAVPLSVTVSYLTYSRASLGGTVIGLAVLLALSRNRWTLLANAAVASVATAVVVLVIRGTPEIADGTGGAGAGRVVAILLGASLASGGAAYGLARAGLDRARLPMRAARATFAVTVALAVVAAAGIATSSVGQDAWESFKQDQDLGETTNDPSQRLTNLNGSRYVIWRGAWQSFKDEPFRGHGAASFEYEWNERGTGSFVRDAHSLYLETLSELGLVGLGLLLLVMVGIAALLVTAVRSSSSDHDRGIVAAAGGAIAAFVFGAGVDWLWESTAVPVLAFTLVGVVIVATGRAVERPSAWIRAALAIVALAMALIQLPGLVSTSEVRKSQQAIAAGDVTEARLHADQAIDAQPWASSPLVQRALVDERAGDLDAARAELQQAEGLDPRNWRIPLILARIEARAGNAEEALVAFRRAKALRPKGQFFTQP